MIYFCVYALVLHFGTYTQTQDNCKLSENNLNLMYPCCTVVIIVISKLLIVGGGKW